MAMAGYTQIEDEIGILEGQIRSQRQGDLEYNFNTYHEKYLDMEGIRTPKLSYIMYGNNYIR